MDHYRFHYCYSGFNLNDANFSFVGTVFQKDPDQVIVVASKDKDNCTLERVEFQDKHSFKVFIKDLTREYIGQRIKFRFHIIYSFDGKLLRQSHEWALKTH